MLLALRAVLLAAVWLGLMLLVVRYVTPRAMLAPFYLNCAAGCLMVAAGVLNLMLPALLMLIALGLWGLAANLRLLPGIMRRWWPVLLAVCAAGAYFAFYFHDTYFVEYDDVSHWAYTVKVMLRADAQPSFQNPIPGHFSYPTGMAGLLYVFLRILGADSDALMMFLQCMVMLSCLLPMLELCRSRLWGGAAVLAGTLLMASELSLLWLRVDMVISILTVGGAAMICAERRMLAKRWQLLLPVVCFLPLVKTSGLLMAAFLTLIFGMMVPADSRRQRLVRMALLAGAAVLGLLLWNRHVALVFEHGMQSRHSISLRHMGAILLSKGIAGNLNTLGSYVQSFAKFTFARPTTLACWALLAFTMLAGWRLDRKRSLQFLSVELGLYLAYMAGLLGMYLFTMPDGQIASFTRYAQTAVIVLLGLMCMRWLEMLNLLLAQKPSRARGWYLGAIAAMAAAALLFSVTSGKLAVAEKEETFALQRSLAARYADRREGMTYPAPEVPQDQDQGIYLAMCEYYALPAELER